MPYIIDGHNLIPNIRGLSLNSMEDELELVELLQEISRKKRQPIEVYFDGAAEGYSGTRKIGTVKVHFIRKGTPADEVIIGRLNKMGNEAKNITVVTSDRHIQAQVRSTGANIMASQAFAAVLAAPMEPDREASKIEKPLSDSEVDQWLDIFKGKSSN